MEKSKKNTLYLNYNMYTTIDINIANTVLFSAIVPIWNNHRVFQ